MVTAGFKTDQGMKRGNNEDALFVLPEQKLYIVADGVGGHNSGELASRLAVGNIAEYVALHPIRQITDDNRLRDYFTDCLSEANRLIYEKAHSDPENAGMATTTVIAYLSENNKAYIVNVGDSRAYLIRDRRIFQITEDHTYVNQLLRAGSITKEEAEHHPSRNMITRAVGGERKVVPDFFQFETYPGDMLILCTDGLFGELTDQEICETALARRSMYGLAGELVKMANERGGKDNVSVICIKI